MGSMRVFKRGATWFASVYVDGKRVKRSTHCRDRAAAEVVARQWERDAADPANAAANSATLDDALAVLIARRREEAAAKRRSPATVRFYEAKSGHLVRVLGDAFPLRKLTAAVVDGYISQRRAEGAADSTVSKELITLRAALKLASRAGLWRGELAAVMPVAFSPEYRPRERALSIEELPALLRQLTSDQLARVAFIVATSARWAESERARREDVAPTSARVRGTKTASSARTVPLVAIWQVELMDLCLRYAKGEGGALFKPWKNCRHDLARACERAGIERVSPNDLRRTTATLLRAMGSPPDLIAAVMGHVDSRMVERVYGRLSTSDLASRLAQALGSGASRDVVTGAMGQWDTGGTKKTPPVAQLAQPGASKCLISMPRDGIEPPTRGFSIVFGGPVIPRLDAKKHRGQFGAGTRVGQYRRRTA